MPELPLAQSSPVVDLLALNHEFLTVCVVTHSTLKRTKLRQALMPYQITLMETTEIDEAIRLAQTVTPMITFLGYDYLTEVLLRLPLPVGHFVLMGSAQELEQVGNRSVFCETLTVPFVPEQVVVTCNKLLEPKCKQREGEQLVAEKLRRFARSRVANVEARLLRPMNIRAEVLDISHQGIHMTVNHNKTMVVDCIFHMELYFEGLSIVLDARLVWVQSGKAAFCFGRTRPPAFERFFSRVMASGVVYG